MKKTYLWTLAIAAVGLSLSQSAQGQLEVRKLSDIAPVAAKADPAAWSLLKGAHDSRETFAPSFPGLSASISFDDNGDLHEGTVSYSAGDTSNLNVQSLSGEAKDWLEDEVGSIFGHRRDDDFQKGEGSDPITFGNDDKSPLGRLVQLHDALQSSYRIKDNQITEVTRTMAGQRFTITVTETIDAGDGKYLPGQFMVTYFDAKTGAIQKVSAYTDSYAKVQGYWLPVSRRVITAQDGQFTTRAFTLSGFHVGKS